MAFWILVIAGLATAARGNMFTCDMMRGDHLQQTRMGFQINTGSNIYTPGGQVKVKLGYQVTERDEHFRFIIQAFKAGSTTETVGSWLAHDGEATMQCDVTNQNMPDTLYVDSEVTSYTVTWQAPEGDKSGDAVDIEFFVVFVDADGDEHRLLSIGMSPAAEPSKLPPTQPPEEIQQPGVDEEKDEYEFHEELTEDQMKMDAEKKYFQEIDLENAATEDDWNKEQLVEMRKREEEEHEEEMEYERILKQEEDERLARIQAEIRDKQEYDARMREAEREEDGTVKKDSLLPNENEMIEIHEEFISGADRLVAGLLSSILFLTIRMLI